MAHVNVSSSSIAKYIIGQVKIQPVNLSYSTYHVTAYLVDASTRSTLGSTSLNVMGEAESFDFLAWPRLQMFHTFVLQ